MDKYTRLQALLREIVDEKCDGNASELARRIERNPTYVNRLFYADTKKGAKGIGVAIMDACTATFDLPRGFWDRDPGEAFSDATTVAPVLPSAPINLELQRGIIEMDRAIQNLSAIKSESLELLFSIWAKRKVHVGTIAQEIFEFLSASATRVGSLQNGLTPLTENSSTPVTKPKWGVKVGQAFEDEKRETAPGRNHAAK